MSTKEKTPSWFSSFKKWVKKPSPTGEWLYRGQAAEYSSIVPSLLRGNNQKYYGNRLYNINYNISEDIIKVLPILRTEGTIKAPPLLSASLFRTDSQLDWREITRALAQHYDYPTLFVDLTLNPMVAAFFATHTFINGKHHVRNDKPGTVYRWPVMRKGPARLIIPSSASEIKNHENNGINAIDLSVTNEHFRRPHNQYAVLAIPVTDPLPFNSMLSLVTPPDKLIVVDLAQLSTCESFQTPPKSGHDLLHISGISSDVMFPDQIDLGYSYVSIMALLSLIIYHPNHRTVPYHTGEKADALVKHYAAGILAGSTILNHECFRLVPGYKPRNIPLTLSAASTTVSVFTEAAQSAIDLIDTEEVSGKVLKRQNEQTKSKLDLLKSVVENTIGDDGNLLSWDNELISFNPTVTKPSTEWMISELDKRYKQTMTIIGKVEKTPVYALQNKDKYSNLLDLFPDDQQYKNKILQQVNSLKLWEKNSSMLLT